MNTKSTGIRAELLACAWLIEHGYQVFRNISSLGMIDLVAIKDEKILRLDVKYGTTTYRLRPAQQRAGITLMQVYDNGDCEIVDTSIPKEPKKTGRPRKTRHYGNGIMLGLLGEGQ